MDKLIEALQIFLKYGNPKYPTICEHDELFVVGYDRNDMLEADLKKLEELGFDWSNKHGSFVSYRYGSA